MYDEFFQEKRTRSEMRPVYKFPCIWAFFNTSQSAYSLKEMHELLAAGMEFSDFETGARSSSSVDIFIARLDE